MLKPIVLFVWMMSACLHAGGCLSTQEKHDIRNTQVACSDKSFYIVKKLHVKESNNDYYQLSRRSFGLDDAIESELMTKPIENLKVTSLDDIYFAQGKAVCKGFADGHRSRTIVDPSWLADYAAHDNEVATLSLEYLRLFDIEGNLKKECALSGRVARLVFVNPGIVVGWNKSKITRFDLNGESLSRVKHMTEKVVKEILSGCTARGYSVAITQGIQGHLSAELMDDNLDTAQTIALTENPLFAAVDSHHIALLESKGVVGYDAGTGNECFRQQTDWFKGSQGVRGYFAGSILNLISLEKHARFDLREKRPVALEE